MNTGHHDPTPKPTLSTEKQLHSVPFKEQKETWGSPASSLPLGEARDSSPRGTGLPQGRGEGTTKGGAASMVAVQTLMVKDGLEKNLTHMAVHKQARETSPRANTAEAGVTASTCSDRREFVNNESKNAQRPSTLMFGWTKPTALGCAVHLHCRDHGSSSSSGQRGFYSVTGYVQFIPWTAGPFV